MPSVVKLKNPKVMTFPGPFRCSQKLSRLDSLPQSEQHPKLLANDAWERIGFRSQVLGTVILSVMLYPIIGDTAARKTNRMIVRAPPSKQMENHILIRQLSRPIIARQVEINDVDESTHVAPHAHQHRGNKANVPRQQRR